MKKATIVLFIITLFTFLNSCKKDNDKGLLDTNINRAKSSTAKTSGSAFDWETTTEITLGDGQRVILPWYNSASTFIPDFILNDYRKSDGWELLYDFCSTSTDLGKFYLIFYNKFTGIIRTYYYMSGNIGNGNQGIWALDITNSSAILNNLDYFAIPTNTTVSSPISISTNITRDGTTKSLTKGWNCFDTEITYDPSSTSKNIRMSIRPFDQNLSTITLEGSYTSTSEGTIITTSSSNKVQSAVSGISKAAGKEASKWIEERMDSVTNKNNNKFIKLSKDALSAIIGGGAKEIVSAGVNLLFGSFIGKFSSSAESKQSIQFKTNGSIKLSGSLTSTSSSNALAVANLYFPGTTPASSDNIFPFYNKSLGVWNIDKAPTIVLDKVAWPTGEYETSDPIQVSRSVSLDLTSFHVIINPDLLPELDHYSVSSELFFYKKFRGKENWAPLSTTIDGYRYLAYEDEENSFYTVANYTSETVFLYSNLDLRWPPKNVYLPPYYLMREEDHRYVVKVTLTLYPKQGYNQEPIVLTRSYLPEYRTVSSFPGY